ncbi:MAG: hypothetical protein ACOC0V_00750, partial [Oceanicaulis sp.]
EPVVDGGRMQGFRVRDNTRLDVLQASGLMPGDVVTTLNGVTLDGAEAAREAVARFESAETAVFTVVRGDETIELSVPLGQEN